jgi:hypothetical protein
MLQLFYIGEGKAMVTVRWTENTAATLEERDEAKKTTVGA